MKIKISFYLLMVAIFIASCSKNQNVDLGAKYSLVTSASMKDLIIVHEKNIVIIQGHILDYLYDSNFIIVAQCPRDSVLGIETMTQSQYEEAFRKSSFKQYWIINKKRKSEFNKATKNYSNVYGPFKKEEYLQKRLEIGVPKELELKE